MKLRLPFRLLAALLVACSVPCVFASETGNTTIPTDNLGNVMYVGDSITHGVNSASWRWAMHKILTDNAVSYTEVGYRTGNYSGGVASGAVYGDVEFRNIHSSQSSARAYEISGRKSGGRFDDTNIQNWLGLSDTKTNGGTYTGSTYDPDTFYLLIGTNDLLSDSGDFETKRNNLSEDVSVILNYMFEKNGNAEVTVLSVPCWVIHANGNDDATHANVASYNESYKVSIEQYNAEHGKQVRYVDVNVGLVDVTSSTPFYGCHSMFNNPGRDGLHPNAQGDLLFAGNVAHAQGYAGRTAGQERKAASEFDRQAADFVLSEGSSLSESGTISLAAGGSATLNWEGSIENNGLTVEFRLPTGLGNGAADGWSSDTLSLTLGDGSISGTLNLTEAYIMWGDTVLYSMDMSGSSDSAAYTVFDTNESIRVAYVNGNPAQSLSSGFYVWLGDMLIGEACVENGSGVSGVLIQNNTSGEISLSGLAFAESSYAPTTTLYAAGNPLIKSGTDVSFWPEVPEANAHLTVSGDTIHSLTSGGQGELVAVVDSGAVSENIYINAQTYAGDIWVTMTGTDIAVDSSAHFNGVNVAHALSGNAYFRVDSAFDGEGTWGTWFGALNGGDISGNLYMEFSSAAFAVAGGTYSGVHTAITGAFNANVGGRITLVFNDGNFDGAVFGGNVNQNKTVGSTKVNIAGGTFSNGNIYAGGSAGTIAGSTSLTLTGNDYVLGRGVNHISAGGTGGTINGNTTLTVEGMDQAAENGLAAYTGTLSGNNGSTVHGLKSLEFRDSVHDNFGATLSNFDSVQLSNSVLRLTSLGGANTVQIDTKSSLTLWQDTYTDMNVVNNGTLIIDGADFSISAEKNDANVIGTYVVDAGRLVLGEGYETFSTFTINGGTLELRNNVSTSGTVTIAEGATLALGGTINNNGSLVINGDVVVDSLAHLDAIDGSISYYDRLAPDSGNGYDSALYAVYRGEGSVEWNGERYITCLDTRYELDADGCVRVGESDGRYFVNEGTVVYGGTDNLAASDSTKVIVLDGGNLTFSRDLRENVNVSLAASSTLTIESGVVVSSSQISASEGSGTLTLAGSGSYDVSGTWDLGSSVVLGRDWIGAARVSGGGEGDGQELTNIDLDSHSLSNENSYIGLNGIMGYFKGGVLTQTSNLLLTNGGTTTDVVGRGEIGYALWIANGNSNNAGNYTTSGAGQKVIFTGKIAGDGDVLVSSHSHLARATSGPDYYHHEFNGDLSEWTGSYIFSNGIYAADVTVGEGRSAYVGLLGLGDVAASFEVRHIGTKTNNLTVEVGGASGNRALSGSFICADGNNFHLKTTGNAVKNFTGEVKVTDVTVAGGNVTFSNALQANALTVESGTVTLGAEADAVLGDVTVASGSHLAVAAAGANLTVNGTLNNATDITATGNFTGGDSFVKTGSGTLTVFSSSHAGTGIGTTTLSNTTVSGGKLQVKTDGFTVNLGDITLNGGSLELYHGQYNDGWATISSLTIAADNATLSSGSGWRAQVDIQDISLNGHAFVLDDAHTANQTSVYRLDGAGAGNGTVEVRQSNNGNFRHTVVSLVGENTLSLAVLNYSTSASGSANNTVAIGAETVRLAGLESGTGFANRLYLISRDNCATNTADNTVSDSTARTLIFTGDGAEHTFAGKVMGSLSLVMNGAGTQKFTGDVSAFNGNLTVNAGSLTFTQTLGHAATVAVSAGAMLNLAGGTADTLRVAGSFNLTGGTLTVNGVLSLTEGFGLNLAAGSTLALGENFVLDLTGLEDEDGSNASNRVYSVFKNIGEGSVSGLADGILDMSHLRVNGVGWTALYENGTITLSRVGTMLTWNNASQNTMTWSAGSEFTEGGTFSDGSYVTFASDVTASLGADISVEGLDVEKNVTLTLAGNSNITVSDINLEIGATLDAGAVSLSGVSTVDLSRDSTLIISKLVEGVNDPNGVTFTGSGTLKIGFTGEGTGTVQMSELSQFTGVVDVTSGTVDFAHSDISNGTWRLSAESDATVSGTIGNALMLEGTEHTLTVARSTATLSGDVSGDGFIKGGAGTLILSGTVALSDNAVTRIESGTLRVNTNGGSVNLGGVSLNGGSLALYFGDVGDGWVTISNLAVDADNSELTGGTLGHRARVDIQGLSLDGKTLVLNDTHTSNHTSVYRFGGESAGEGTVEARQSHNGTDRHTAISLIGENTLSQAVLNYSLSNSMSSRNSVAIGADTVRLAGLEGGTDFANRLYLVSRYDCVSDVANANHHITSDGTVRTLIFTGDGNEHIFAGKVMDSLNFVMDGVGTQRFSGDISAFNGSITVKVGTLAFSGNLSGGNTVLLNGGTLELGASATFSTLSGTGGVLSGTAGTSHALTLTGEGGYYAGALSGISDLTLAASATGSHEMSGNLGSLSTVTVNGGTLALTEGATSDTIGDVTIGGGALNLARGTTVGTINTVTVDGGSLNLAGAVSTIAAATVSDGTMSIAQGATVGTIGTVTVSGGTLTLAEGATVGTINLSDGVIGGEIGASVGTLKVTDDLNVTGGTISDITLEYAGAADAELGAAMNNSSLVVSGDGNLTLNSAAAMNLVNLTTNGDITIDTDVSVSGDFSLSEGADIRFESNRLLSYGSWNYISDLDVPDGQSSAISKAEDGTVAVQSLRMMHTAGGTEEEREAMAFTLKDVRLVNADGHIELSGSDNVLRDLVISGGSVKLSGDTAVTGDVNMATFSAQLLLAENVTLTNGIVTITGLENTVIDNNVANATLFAAEGRAVIENAAVTIAAEGTEAYSWGASLMGQSSLTTSGDVTLSNTEGHELSALTVTSGSLTLDGDVIIGTETAQGVLTMNADTSLEIAAGKTLTDYISVDEGSGRLDLTGRTEETNAVIRSAEDGAVFNVNNDRFTIENAKVTVDTAEGLNVTSVLSDSEVTVLGGGYAGIKVQEDTVNDFDAAEGSVTVETTGDSGTAKVGNLTVGAEQTLTVNHGYGSLELSGKATVTGGSVDADVVVQSGAAMAVAAEGSDSSGVSGNLTVLGGGKLTLRTAEAVTVGGELTLAVGATIEISDVVALGESVTIAMAGSGISLADGVIISDAGLTGASHLIVSKGSDMAQQVSLFSARAAQADTLMATRVSNDVISVGALQDGIITLTTNLDQTYIDSLLAAGITRLELMLKGDIADQIRENAGSEERISIALDGLNLTGMKTLTLNGYAGIGEGGQGTAAYQDGAFRYYTTEEVVPEPATATLSLLALAALAARRRRRQNA